MNATEVKEQWIGDEYEKWVTAIAEKEKLRQLKWRTENAERIRQYNLEKNSTEKERLRTRKWREANRDKHRNSQRAYVARLRGDA